MQDHSNRRVIFDVEPLVKRWRGKNYAFDVVSAAEGNILAIRVVIEIVFAIVGEEKIDEFVGLAVIVCIHILANKRLVENVAIDLLHRMIQV